MVYKAGNSCPNIGAFIGQVGATLGQPSPLYRVGAILIALNVSNNVWEIWSPKARKYVPPHVNIFFVTKSIPARWARSGPIVKFAKPAERSLNVGWPQTQAVHLRHEYVMSILSGGL